MLLVDAWRSWMAIWSTVLWARFNICLLPMIVSILKSVHSLLVQCTDMYFSPKIEGEKLVIHHWSYKSGESGNWESVSMWLSIQTHISVTAGSNFVILGVMGYGLGMMPVVFLYSLVSQMHRQKCLFPNKILVLWQFGCILMKIYTKCPRHYLLMRGILMANISCRYSNLYPSMVPNLFDFIHLSYTLYLVQIESISSESFNIINYTS